MSKHKAPPSNTTPSPAPARDPEIAPTLGRVVLVQLERPEPFPAMVTSALDPAAIECEVLGTSNGSQVMRAVPYDPDGAPGSWRWPPRAG